MQNTFVVLTRAPLDARAVEQLVAHDSAGAVVLFEGLTRDQHQGRGVNLLEYEAHEELALKMLERLRENAISRFQLTRAAVYHRLGKVAIGEASVVIAASSAHRAAAFDGCRFLIDELKTNVPIWKKEYYADSSTPAWVGPDGGTIKIRV